MRVYSLQISVPRVNITMRFPCKLQVGCKINDSETLTDDIVELKTSAVSFKSTLAVSFSYNQETSQLVYEEQVLSADQSAQLILYAVYARRKIAIGFISINIVDIISKNEKHVILDRKWERCPDKSASVLAEINITKESRETEAEEDVNTLVCGSEGRNEEWKDEAGCDETVKKYGNNLLSPPTIHRIPHLKLLMESYPCEKMYHEKYIKIPEQKQSENSKFKFRKKSSQDLLFEKSLELKGFQMSGFELTSPDSRPKKSSNCNFLSPEDEEYVKSLKIVIVPNSESESNLNHSFPIHPDLIEKYPMSPSESQILQALQSPRSSIKQFLRSSAPFPSSRGVAILQKKLALTEEYYKAELQKYSKKLLKAEQQRQDLTVQLSIKQDQIRWMNEEKEKSKLKIVESGIKPQKLLLLQGEQYSITKLKYVISQLQGEIQESLGRIEYLGCELESEKSLRMSYQEKVGVYYVRAENDRETIGMMNMELMKLNSIIKDLVYEEEKKREEAPPLTGRQKGKGDNEIPVCRKSKNLYIDVDQGRGVDERVNELLKHVETIENELKVKEELIVKGNQKQCELEHQMISLSNKLTKFNKKEREVQKFIDQRQKYLDDIKFLAQKVEDLQNQVRVAAVLSTQLQQTSQNLATQNLKLQQELRAKEKSSLIDEENIRQFQKQLSEKYKVIYSLQNCLKEEKEKSRSLSRSIDGRSHLGKILQFSFNQHCNHNFIPLCTKVKEIQRIAEKNRFQVIKSLNVSEKDPYEVQLVRHYDYFRTVLKQFTASLEEMIEKEQRSPRGSMSRFAGGSE